MRINIGSKTILYGWHDDIRRLIYKDDANKIAEEISEGKTNGQFFNDSQQMIGWWIEKNHEM